MVAAVIGFAPALIDLGTSDAATQKSQITRGEVSALFWFNMAMGCGLAVVVAACGPLIAWVYKEDRLQMVALVSSLQLVFVAISCQHNALLRRAMMFNRIAAAEVFGNLLSAAIVMAMAAQGLEYWALVARPILTAMLTSGGILLACPWLPGLPSLTAEVKHLLRFGMNITGFTVLDSVSRSADRFALGVTSNARDVGLYQQAIALYESPLYLIAVPIHGVAVTSLSKLRSDLEDLRKTWTKALSALTFYAMPAFGALAVVSRDLIVLLLGVKWSYTGILLSILAVRGVAHVVERTLGWLHVAAGRADRWRRWGVFSTVCQLGAVAGGLPFGTMGVAIALALMTYALFLPAIAYAGRPLGIGIAMVAKVVCRQLLGALVSIPIGLSAQYFLLDEFHAPLRIVLASAIYVTSYLVIVVWLFRMREPLQVGLSAIKGFIPSMK